MVWTLQRYIFREMGRGFVLTALGLIALLSMGGGVLNMIQVEELTARQLLKLMALVIPVAASLTLPIAAMFSAAATYGRLASDNEFVACRGSGINIQILLLPALTIALVTGLVTFFCINSVIPTTVSNLDRIVGRDLRSIVSQRLRRPGGRIPGLKRYRMYWEESPPSPPGLEDGFLLLGVAFLEMDNEAVVRIGTAGQVQIRLTQQQGRATISGVMRDITYFEPQTGNFSRAKSLTILPNAVPFTLPMKLKFLTLRELVDFRNRPQRWHEVRQEFRKLRVAVGRAMVYQNLLEQSRQNRAINLAGVDGSYTLESGSLPFVERDGSLTFRGAGGGAAGVEITEIKGGRSRRITAGRANLDISRADALAECEVIIRLYDNVVLPHLTQPDRTIVQPQAKLTGIPLPSTVVAGATALTDIELLTGRDGSDDDPLVKRQRAETNLQLGVTVRKITGIIHQRAAFTASVFVLVALAAILGIRFRHAHLLAAFGISFVPSLLVIVAIVMGKQLAENEDTVTSGLLVMWSGLGAVALLDLWLLTRVLRR